MAKQTINLGSAPNDRTGDKLRVAFDKINDNFTELYDGEGSPVDATRLLNELAELLLSEDRVEFKLSDSTKWGVVQRENGDTLLFSNNGDLLLCSNDGPVWTLVGDGDTKLPDGSKVTFRRYDGDSLPAGDSYIQAGMGFRFASGEGIYLSGVDMTDPENPVYHTLGVDSLGTTSIPGAIITTPVAPNSGTQAVGRAAAISVTNSPRQTWSYGTGVVANGINFVVDIDAFGNGVATVSTINDGGSGHYVGETFGPVSGEAFGGASPADDMYFVVDAVDADVYSDIDLTKATHVLDGDFYRLLDGWEGQIIYLVQAPDTDPNSYCIQVVNGRVGSNTYTDIWFAPFYGANSGVVTMIFTNGAWAASGGSWD